MRYQSQLPSPPGRFSRTGARHAHTSVELKLRTPHQLFDERDPSPFRERDLDDDAAKYIHGSFRDLRDHRRAKLSIYFETLGEFRDRPQIIVDAIHSFFSFEADSKRRELREIFRQGVIALFIGICFLFSCTSIGRSMKVDESGWQLAAMLKEGSIHRSAAMDVRSRWSVTTRPCMQRWNLIAARENPR